MRHALTVDPAVVTHLGELARRYRGLAPALKIAGVIPATQAFVEEIEERSTDSGFLDRFAEGQVSLYRVPEADLGAGPPTLDVGVVVGRGRARLFFVEAADGAAEDRDRHERLLRGGAEAAERLHREERDHEQRNPS